MGQSSHFCWWVLVTFGDDFVWGKSPKWFLRCTPQCPRGDLGRKMLLCALLSGGADINFAYSVQRLGSAKCTFLYFSNTHVVLALGPLFTLKFTQPLQISSCHSKYDSLSLSLSLTHFPFSPSSFTRVVEVPKPNQGKNGMRNSSVNSGGCFPSSSL